MKLVARAEWKPSRDGEPPPLKRASLGARALVALASRFGPQPEGTGVYQAIGREKLEFTQAFLHAFKPGFAGVRPTDPLLKYTAYGSGVSLALTLGCRGPFWALESDELAGAAALQQAQLDLRLGRCPRALVCSTAVDGRAFLLVLEPGELRVKLEWKAEWTEAASHDLHGVGELGTLLERGSGAVALQTPDGRGVTVTIEQSPLSPGGERDRVRGNPSSSGATATEARRDIGASTLSSSPSLSSGSPHPHPLPARGEGVRDLLVRAAQRHRDAPFLIDGADGTTHSYTQALENARRWAAWLRAKNLSRVAIALPNSLDYAELLFGAALCGTVVCPINPSLLETEVHELQRRFDAPTLLCTSARADELNGISVGKKGELPHALPPPAALEALPAPAPDALLSLMLSSGTSGTSKLCRITHASAVHTSRHTAEAFGHAPGTRYLTPLPLFHINAQVVGLYAAAQAGSAIALSARLPAAQLWSAVERTQAIGMSAVPAILHDLLASPEQPPECLEYVVTSSAPLADHVREAFENRFRIPLYVCYGLTECTGYAAYGPGPIGAVGAPRGAELQIGDEGEVLIRGPGVFGGYLDGPSVVHDGWLHTGDVGELVDGQLVLRGRIKEMINRGGEKIAPAEIEAVLTQVPGVVEAGVFGVPDERLGEELAAALVCSRDVSDDALFDFCSERLSEFRTPRSFFRLSELPKGGTGKLLRRKLLEACGLSDSSRPSPQPSPRQGRGGSSS